MQIGQAIQLRPLFTKKNKTEGPPEFPYFYELFGVHRDDRERDPARRYKMGFLTGVKL
jgi:hypothetical protein